MLVCAPNFMRECDVVVDPAWGPCDLNQDLSNKKVFVNIDYFEWVVPSLEQSSNVTLVLHHSDRSVDRIMFEAARPFCRRILAQNCEIIHPKLIQAPIGFAWGHVVRGIQPSFDDSIITRVKRMDLTKDIDVFVNVGTHENNEMKFNNVRALRKTCLNAFPERDKTRRPLEDFLKTIKRSKYVICPIGFGLDTHRFWEAAYLGARPVVITSGLDETYKRFGAVVLNDWTDPLPEWTPPDVPEDAFHTGFWMAI